MSVLAPNPILLAGASSAVGSELVLEGYGTTVCFEVILEASAATLVGTLQFTGGITPFATYPEFIIGAGFSQITTAPAGYNVANVGNNGRLVFASPASGRTSIVLKIVGLCPRIVKPVWTYTSGGGTVALRVIPYGFGIGTTP